jgi:hypothetical protein
MGPSNSKQKNMPSLIYLRTPPVAAQSWSIPRGKPVYEWTCRSALRETGKADDAIILNGRSNGCAAHRAVAGIPEPRVKCPYGPRRWQIAVPTLVVPSRAANRCPYGRRSRGEGEDMRRDSRGPPQIPGSATAGRIVAAQAGYPTRRASHQEYHQPVSHGATFWGALTRIMLWLQYP